MKKPYVTDVGPQLTTMEKCYVTDARRDLYDKNPDLFNGKTLRY